MKSKKLIAFSIFVIRYDAIGFRYNSMQKIPDEINTEPRLIEFI